MDSSALNKRVFNNELAFKESSHDLKSSSKLSFNSFNIIDSQEALNSLSLFNPIKIVSSVPFVNKAWIRSVINDFIKLNYPFLNDYSLELNVVQEYSDGKLISTSAVMKFFNGIVFASGKGVDEYEAVFDLLNNIDLELRTAGLKKNSIVDLAYHSQEELFNEKIFDNIMLAKNY